MRFHKITSEEEKFNAEKSFIPAMRLPLKLNGHGHGERSAAKGWKKICPPSHPNQIYRAIAVSENPVQYHPVGKSIPSSRPAETAASPAPPPLQQSKSLKFINKNNLQNALANGT